MVEGKGMREQMESANQKVYAPPTLEEITRVMQELSNRPPQREFVIRTGWKGVWIFDWYMKGVEMPINHHHVLTMDFGEHGPYGFAINWDAKHGLYKTIVSKAHDGGYKFTTYGGTIELFQSDTADAASDRLVREGLITGKKQIKNPKFNRYGPM